MVARAEPVLASPPAPILGRWPGWRAHGRSRGRGCVRAGTDPGVACPAFSNVAFRSKATALPVDLDPKP